MIWREKGRRYMFVNESLTVNIWKITPISAGVERAGDHLARAGVIRANKVITWFVDKES